MLRSAAAVVLPLAATAVAQRADGQFWPCNPIKNATGACPPDPGLAHSSYTIDFTEQKSIPSDWTVSNYATINWGPLGAEFTYNKRYDAPQLWTNFFIFFGRVDVELRIANGTGIISSAVLMSDDFDEIDFEFSGNNFGKVEWAAGKGQSNYFGKGITGNYDRGSFFDVSSPQQTFHTYSIDWTPDRLMWLLDGKVLRRFSYASSSGDQGNYQYPQTPSKFQLGIWAGGDADQNPGTKNWAGGTTDVNGGPYTMYVRKVSIQNMYPAAAYNWTDQSGRWQSIKLLQEEQPVGGGSSPTVTPIAAGGSAHFSASPSLRTGISTAPTSRAPSSSVEPPSSTPVQTPTSASSSKPTPPTKPTTKPPTPTVTEPAEATTRTSTAKKHTTPSPGTNTSTCTKKVSTTTKLTSRTCAGAFATNSVKDWEWSPYGWGRWRNDDGGGRGGRG